MDNASEKLNFQQWMDIYGYNVSGAGFLLANLCIVLASTTEAAKGNIGPIAGAFLTTTAGLRIAQNIIRFIANKNSRDKSIKADAYLAMASAGSFETGGILTMNKAFMIGAVFNFFVGFCRLKKEKPEDHKIKPSILHKLKGKPMKQSALCQLGAFLAAAPGNIKQFPLLLALLIIGFNGVAITATYLTRGRNADPQPTLT